MFTIAATQLARSFWTANHLSMRSADLSDCQSDSSVEVPAVTREDVVLAVDQVRREVAADKEALLDGVAQVVAELTDRIAALEKQIEQRKYCGVWRVGQAYAAGNEVTHDGARWHANQDTTVRPGTDAAAWTLCVKSEQPPALALLPSPRTPTVRGTRRNNAPP